ncbi:MAG TPA: cobyrinate a,c-diamide synthase [Isosphaeraceae bacterium]|nr:cobyrinate a,c-diamide synthase [Isosphaeraceae bacterium]
MPVPAVVIGGTHSGSGKTAVSLALMAALVRRGFTVQGFKVGPDFLDPGHHTRITGRPSRNLDTWLLKPEALAASYQRATAGADIAVIEGVMGLFDGRGALDERGSTADLARLWNLPVVLVVDARGLARSIAALVRGFATFDPRVELAGAIANRVGSRRHHDDYLAPSLRALGNVPTLGFLERNPALAIPERHLGLMTSEEFAAVAPQVDALADAAEAGLQIDRLVELARAPDLGPIPQLAPAVSRPNVRVAVARDPAFCFYYEDNFDHLRDAGAELLPFSPLADEGLPAGVELVYLGGGYPELFASRLSANAAMRAAITRFHADGGAILAECGGLMACCETLADLAGDTHTMWGLIPARVVMQGRLAALGYVTVATEQATRLGPAGTAVLGHEFHYSRLEAKAPLPYATQLVREDRAPRPDGIQIGGLLAGYAHMHIGSNVEVARRLVGANES